MLRGSNGFEFVWGSRTWVLVPSFALSHDELRTAVPAEVAASELERWCSDPLIWRSMVQLFESVASPITGPLTTRAVERQIKPTLRSALHGGAWVAFQTTASAQIPALEIVAPTRNTAFILDDTPRMPTIDVIVRATGILPDPTATTAFEWSAELLHNPRSAGDRNGPNRNFSTSASGSSVGERFTVRLTALMAGDLTCTVRAIVGGTSLSASTVGLTIEAKNPTKVAVQAEIGDGLLQRIACHESGQRQFAAAPGNTTRSPLWSGDRRGGVGLFQITVPPPTDAQVWNWKENVAAGRDRLEQGRRAARNYPRQIRRSRTLADMLTRLNQKRHAAGRSPIPAITVPDFGATEVEDDAVRAFNGYGSNRDQFGFPLHEFRLAMAGTDLRMTIDETALAATAEWERVPVADRGTSGDPNYVNNVRGANPACP